MKLWLWLSRPESGPWQFAISTFFLPLSHIKTGMVCHSRKYHYWLLIVSQWQGPKDTTLAGWNIFFLSQFLMKRKGRGNCPKSHKLAYFGSQLISTTTLSNIWISEQNQVGLMSLSFLLYHLLESSIFSSFDFRLLTEIFWNECDRTCQLNKIFSTKNCLFVWLNNPVAFDLTVYMVKSKAKL